MYYWIQAYRYYAIDSCQVKILYIKNKLYYIVLFFLFIFRLYNETTHSPPPNRDQRSHSYIFRDIPKNSIFPLFFNTFSRFCIFMGLYHFWGVHKRITMLYNDHAINERGSPPMVARCRVEPLPGIGQIPPPLHGAGLNLDNRITYMYNPL